MKIMDISSEETECQIETVIHLTPDSIKKTKQARLPFQTLSADASIINKKRKSQSSPDARNIKQAKLITKENSLKILEKSEPDDVSFIEEVSDHINEENKLNEGKNNKQDTNPATVTETSDLRNKKCTPNKGLSKTKKIESKVQVNSLTKFLKKVSNKESKETKHDIKTSSSKPVEDIEIVKYVNEQNVSEKNDMEKHTQDSNNIKNTVKINDQNNCTKTVTNKNDIDSDSNMKKSEKLIETESNNSSSNIGNENAQPENADLDSHSNSLSDDSNNDDDHDDSSKSDTDCKKTEHEDTDSKDDVNRSTTALPVTPKSKKLLSSTGSVKKLTPKQIEKKLESQKKRENREKQRQEREKKLQEERESRKKEKEEKRKERDEKRKEREEKEKALKELKRKEKEQKDLKKQAEIEQKQKEKEAKEEERRKREEAKEEEKRRKEEERLEAERKKLKAASNFVSFFVAKKLTEAKPAEEEKKVERKNFMPFEIKADMRVAPIARRILSVNEKLTLDKFLLSSEIKKSELYINEVKDQKFNIRKAGKTWPYEANDDVTIIEDEEEASSNIIQASNASVERKRAKLLLFEENRRPPYWGTWCKKSTSINPRHPFAKDTKWFDYEVDSDDEWEEEEPGESLHGSDDEKDEENAEENEYDVDNDFMVPHGYLSEEEIGADEEDEDDELNPEKQNAKLKILGEQFEAERNEKTKKLKPKVIGCVWLKEGNTYPENTPTYAIKFLTIRHAWVRDIPVSLTPPADADNLYDECGTPSSKHNIPSSTRKAKALEEAMPDLIRLMHGNTHGRGFLMKEFLEFRSKTKERETPIPKAKLHQRMKEIAKWMACPDAGVMHDKPCWYVTQENRTKYLGQDELTLPNTWTYILTPKKKLITAEPNDKPEEKEKDKEKKTAPLITQFTKALTAEEMQKQLTEKVSSPTITTAEKSSTSTPGSKSNTPLMRQPKRASLISVPRGEPFPKSPRVSLIDIFIKKDGNSSVSNNSEKNIKSKVNESDDDYCMVIDNSDEKIDVISISPKTELNKSDDNKTSIINQDVSMENEQDNDKPANESANSEVDVIGV